MAIMGRTQTYLCRRCGSTQRMRDATGSNWSWGFPERVECFKSGCKEYALPILPMTHIGSPADQPDDADNRQS